MDSEITIWLDEEHQIVRQRVRGPVTQEGFARLDTETKAHAARLQDPRRIRILADMTSSDRPTAEVRRQMARTLQRPDFHKMAILGASTFDRVLLRFLCIAAGTPHVVPFASEADALAWLLE